jgi:hypothetical protein
MAHNGVSAFNIEVSALSIFVSAIQYKNAGKKLPSSPAIITVMNLILRNFFPSFYRKGQHYQTCAQKYGQMQPGRHLNAAGRSSSE